MGNNCTSKPKQIINSQYYIETLDDPKETQAYNKGRILEYQGKYHEAIKCFNKAIEHNSNSAMSYNGIANCHLKRGHFEEAVSFYNKALQVDPNNKFSLNGLGTCYHNLGDNQTAIDYFNKAIDVDNNFSYPYNGLGNLYYLGEKYSQSVPYFERAVSLSPSNPLMHANLACAYAMLGRTEEAVSSIQKARSLNNQNEAELSPENKYYLSYKMSEFQRVIKYVEKDRQGLELKNMLLNSRSDKKIPLPQTS